MKPILIAGLSALTMMMCPEFANGQGILKRLKDGVKKEATRIVQDEVEQATNRVFSEGEKVLKGGSGKKSTNQERTDTDSSVSTTSKTSSNTTSDKPLYTFDPNIDPRLQVQRDFEINVHNREKRKFCCDAYQKWRRPHAEVLLEAGEDILYIAFFTNSRNVPLLHIKTRKEQTSPFRGPITSFLLLSKITRKKDASDITSQQTKNINVVF